MKKGQTFVISLTSSGERRQSIQRQFREQGSPFEFIDAVNGDDLDIENDPRIDPAAANQQPHILLPRVIGCALSHSNIYKLALERNLDYAIVLEDDARIFPGFEKSIKEISEHLQANEIILLYYCSWTGLSLYPGEITSNGAHSICTFSEKDSPVAGIAYMISRDACRTLSEFVLPVQWPADEWGFFRKNGAIHSLRCVYPQLADSFDFKSTICYLKKGSLQKKVSRLVDKYKIFPLRQYLRSKRKRLRKKMQKVKVITATP